MQHCTMQHCTMQHCTKLQCSVINTTLLGKMSSVAAGHNQAVALVNTIKTAVMTDHAKPAEPCAPPEPHPHARPHSLRLPPPCKPTHIAPLYLQQMTHITQCDHTCCSVVQHTLGRRNRLGGSCVTSRNIAMADDTSLLYAEGICIRKCTLLCSTGWTGVVEVEAHVVTIKNAAMADDTNAFNIQ